MKIMWTQWLTIITCSSIKACITITCKGSISVMTWTMTTWWWVYRTFINIYKRLSMNKRIAFILYIVIAILLFVPIIPSQKWSVVSKGGGFHMFDCNYGLHTIPEIVFGYYTIYTYQGSWSSVLRNDSTRAQ